MIYLDTSALIRLLTNDDTKKAKKVKALIESGKQLVITDVVFPELEYVLISETYNASRKNILKAFKFLVSQNNIEVSNHISEAVAFYENITLDIADCIIAASSQNKQLASFDKKLLNVKGVNSYW